MSDSSSASPSNKLGGQTSPYLLQHKDNPVHWQPWGEEALARAKAEDKPILLSIGYAACHWCHVMAHESFENEEIAGLMNRLYVNVKVDREERPDLDGIYQMALALLGESGGWPLTMFLTPDGEPFWGGTYFPPAPRYGRQGFPQVLVGVADAFAQQRDKVETNVSALRDGLAKVLTSHAGELVDATTRLAIAEQVTRQFDPFEGGLGSAPKFPQPSILKFLWRSWKGSGAEPFRHAVELTLSKMCQGGIYDHLGGGFARYSVDNRWLVPHFEKMLYDNAQMLQCLTWAWQDTGKPLYAVRVRETVEWLLREMMAEDEKGEPCGAFAATLDADSEGEEGKFYVWQSAEIDALLGADSDFFKATYDVTPQGNWEGKTILNRSRDSELKADAEEERLAKCREILLRERAKRVRPGWDDKVLADWNGLMITALAEASEAFDEPGWLAAAERAFAFVCDTLDQDGRLSHAWRRGVRDHPASLDDYAFMIEAALALHGATGEDEYLTQALAWTGILETHYWDSTHGGFFFSADDTADLIVRSKTAQDNATPSGNGVMVAVYARLHGLTGEETHRAQSEALFQAFSGALSKQALGMTTLLAGAEVLDQAQQIVIRGDLAAEDTRALLRTLRELCLPNRVLQVVPPDKELPEGHPAAGRGMIEDKATAYLCRGQTCSLPVTAPADFAALLKDDGGTPATQPQVPRPSAP